MKKTYEATTRTYELDKALLKEALQLKPQEEIQEVAVTGLTSIYIRTSEIIKADQPKQEKDILNKVVKVEEEKQAIKDITKAVYILRHKCGFNYSEIDNIVNEAKNQAYYK